MSTPSNGAAQAREQFREGSGQFGTQPKSESGVSIDPRDEEIRRDLDALTDFRGAFVNGYSEDDIEDLAQNLETIDLVCQWDVYDDYGYGGDSTILVRDRNDSPGSGWHIISGALYDHLFSPEEGGPLTAENLHVFDPRLKVLNQDIQAAMTRVDGANHAASADDTAEACSFCEASLDDGEGYDGYCGACADLIEAHNEGEHASYARDADCPNCNGADVTWS
jgi:hypothetical protein